MPGPFPWRDERKWAAFPAASHREKAQGSSMYLLPGGLLFLALFGMSWPMRPYPECLARLQHDRHLRKTVSTASLQKGFPFLSWNPANGMILSLQRPSLPGFLWDVGASVATRSGMPGANHSRQKEQGARLAPSNKKNKRKTCAF